MFVEPSEARSKKRFRFQQPFAAAFDGQTIALLDLSQEGAQAGHEEQILVGREATLEVNVPGARTISLRAVAVWSRDSGQEFPRRTGIRITEERVDLAADVLDYFVRLRKVRFDKESLTRKPATLEETRSTDTKTAAASPEDQERVRQALLFVAQPGRMTEFWMQLAESTRAEERMEHPLEVIAAWELIDRAIDIDQVAHICQG
ncbi:MAG TPA: hypothetical protein VHL58_00860 [Thermoanaerobaculia bacterium]|nr:hypothetical protein [Thermoanaerobaculia bacterium]